MYLSLIKINYELYIYMKTVNGALEIFRKKLFKLSHRQILKMSSDIHSHVKSFSKNSLFCLIKIVEQISY